MYNTKNYTEQGGDVTHIGGKLIIDEGGSVEGLPSGGSYDIPEDSTATTVAALREDFNGLLAVLRGPQPEPEPTEYDITVDASATEAVTAAKVDGVVVTKAAEGATVALTVGTLAEGKAISVVETTSEDEVTYDSTENSFTMPAAAVTIKVVDETPAEEPGGEA